MKKLFIFSIAILTVSTTVTATDYHNKYNTIATTNTVASLTDLLTLYYNIKDALVTGKADIASAKAGEFVKAINGIDMKALSEADHKAFMTVNEKLAFDAEHIAESKDLTHQRDHFKTFSDNFFTLAKSVKLSAQPVYQQYCPMKKASWLSSETAIKNPYYGSAMLTCGSVKVTL